MYFSPSIAIEVPSTTSSSKPDLSDPLDGETDHWLESQTEEDEEVLELLRQIQADVPRISSIRLRNPRLQRSVRGWFQIDYISP